jgi:regulator of replication initiation timing
MLKKVVEISSEALTELQEKAKKLEEENRELRLKIDQVKEKLKEIIEQL